MGLGWKPREKPLWWSCCPLQIEETWIKLVSNRNVCLISERTLKISFHNSFHIGSHRICFTLISHCISSTSNTVSLKLAVNNTGRYCTGSRRIRLVFFEQSWLREEYGSCSNVPLNHDHLKKGNTLISRCKILGSYFCVLPCSCFLCIFGHCTERWRHGWEQRGCNSDALELKFHPIHTRNNFSSIDFFHCWHHNLKKNVVMVLRELYEITHDIYIHHEHLFVEDIHFLSFLCLHLHINTLEHSTLTFPPGIPIIKASSGSSWEDGLTGSEEKNTGKPAIDWDCFFGSTGGQNWLNVGCTSCKSCIRVQTTGGIGWYCDVHLAMSLLRMTLIGENWQWFSQIERHHHFRPDSCALWYSLNLYPAFLLLGDTKKV